MPLLLLIIGGLFISAAMRNKLSGSDGLSQLLAKDFSGPNNFWLWIGAISMIAAIGSVKSLQGVSRLFLGLVILAMVISDQGFLAKLVAAIQAIKYTPPTVTPATPDTTSGWTGPLSNPTIRGVLWPDLPTALNPSSTFLGVMGF